jgi:hypothetical protein
MSVVPAKPWAGMSKAMEFCREAAACTGALEGRSIGTAQTGDTGSHIIPDPLRSGR